ncbi:MAG: ABC transporter permease [Clostridium sp.]|nr:ABC transporter permease [Clostridium sp.]
MPTDKHKTGSGGAGRSLLRCLAGILLFLGIWQLLTLRFPPLVLPTIPQVIRQLAAIISGKKFLPTVSLTVMRFLIGLAVGVTAGTLLGILFGLSKRIEDMFSPLVSMLQAVPPVCWVVLALVWFGFNGKPCVFIVATASIPPMVLNISKGIHSIDPELLEMARLYRFSRRKTLEHVVLPSIRPYFLSALSIVIGGGWKLVVMGEVLTTSTGMGGAITTARLNIEPDVIIAWAVILVVLCFVSEALMKLLMRKGGRTNA